LYRKGRFLEGVCLLLLLLLLIQWVFIYRHTERILLIPPDIKYPIPFYSDHVSKEYLEAMAYWYVGLALNVTPAVASYQKELFLRYAAPGAYSRLQQEAEQMFSYIRRNNITTIFSPKEITVDPQSLVAKVSGTLDTWVADKKASTRKATYAVHFMQSNWSLYVSKFYEVDADSPSSPAGGNQPAGK
jgi:conjugal transfer pilus assembly protein TraE